MSCPIGLITLLVRGFILYTSLTSLVESEDRYTLVMYTPILGSFVASLILVFSPFFVFIMPSVIKGRRVVREHMLRNWLTYVGIHILR